MSFFKKPKKNIRRRPVFGENDESGEENDRMDLDDEEENVIRIKEKTSKTKTKTEYRKQTLLSFEEDFNEADDGEVFQVKKSSQSKKMMKLLDKERKKRREVKSEKSEKQPEIKKKDKEIVTGDLVVVVKQTEPVRPLVPILNGREAETADPDYMSDDEEDSKDEMTKHKFSQPDSVRILLESGRIPDAAMIHAARKRRQKAREMGGDFVPLEDAQRYTQSNSRLVREDDNDGTDDEEPVQMTVPSAARDRDRKREAFMSVQNDFPEQESDKGEDEEWESQQIRKGVTGAQLAAVQQENLYQQQYTIPMVPSKSVGVLDHGKMELETASLMSISEGAVDSIPVVDKPFSILKSENNADTPQNISARLSERLKSLREVHRRHQLDRDQAVDDLVTTKSQVKHHEEEAPKLALRFRFYQELRGYVTDLVECLDEKVPILVNLEQRVLALWRKQAEELAERRRQDVRDQATEHFLKTASSVAKRNREEEEAMTRRAAEREGRRIRRMKARENRSALIPSSKHLDGMSSDEEMTELQLSSFRAQKETIEADATHVFEDVVDEFCTVRSVLDRFEQWRITDWESYTEAYVSLCIPKVLAPLLRLQLLMWNPILEESSKLEKMKWYDSLLLYGLQPNETEESLKKDPDLKLVPLVIEKVVLPKLNQIIESTWDPLSTTQTTRLVSLLSGLLQEYPSLVSSSKPLNTLLSTIVDKMKFAVEHDVFIPIYPKQMVDPKTGQTTAPAVNSGMTAFFQRQVVSAIKLLRNLLSWQGIVSDIILQEVALGALLNRYLIVALRTTNPVDAAAKCHMISSTFPRWWFMNNDTYLPQLQMFANQCKQSLSLIDATSVSGRQAVERITNILRTISPVVTPPQ